MNLQEFLFVIISLHLVLGNSENISSETDNLITNADDDIKESSNREARHTDGFFNFGFKSKHPHHPHAGPKSFHSPDILFPGQKHPALGPLGDIKNFIGLKQKQYPIDATQKFIANARQQLPVIGSCRKALVLPQNVMYECRDTNCKLSCKKNYAFPGEVKQLNVICISGNWVVRDYQMDSIPQCEPVCLPPCQNNGICLEPGLCKCPENFYGPFCQNRNLQCASKPKIPLNSKVSCRSNKCNVECMKGYQFPDGSGITNIECLNGQWHHAKSGEISAPDCQPICDPACSNGGTCVSFNMCKCLDAFRGPRCQYGMDVCNMTNSAFNGNYRCSFDMTGASCSLSCPDGIPLSGPQMINYRCEYSTGVFSPPLPKCLIPKGVKIISSTHSQSGGYYGYNNNKPQDVDNSLEFITKWKARPKTHELFSSSEEYIERPLVYSLYFEEGIDITIDRTPKPALCATWSAINLKTFDGTIFKTPLSCSHTLVSDKIDGTFDVVLKGCPFGSGYNCPHSLKIFWQSIMYTFENANGTIKLSTSQKNLPIPVQVKGMKVLPAAQHLRIDLDSVGLSILWDKYQFVAIQAGPGLWNRVGGLCGSLDGDHRNDFISRDGIILKTGKAFTDSWKVPDSSPLCFMDNSGEVDFTKQCEPSQQVKAIDVCEQLLTNAKLSECIKPYNLNAIMKACVSDYCNCANKEKPELCNCDAVAMMAKECEFRGLKLENGWRNLQICPIHCNYGRVYLPCGPNLEPTCGSDVTPNHEKCNEGCFCPEGTVQYKDSCISPELCPCSMRNKEFKAGSTIKKDCNTCSCKNGSWKCTDEHCGSRCAAIGDPHYTTFDGKKFDFMGKCSYYLLKTNNITVEGENVPCSGAISEAMDYAPAYTQDTPSCTKSVTITTVLNGAETKLKLGQNLATFVNGKEVLKFPKVLGNGQVLVRQASSSFITVDFDDGLRIWWDGQTRVYIDAPPTYREKTTGLCGTFNSKTQDDFLTPEGDIETAVEPFANKWRTTDTCDDMSRTETGPHPCTANPEMREIAEKHCAWLTDDIFLDCQWSVEPETYYENCIYDVCACKEDPSKCFCPILAAYGAECTRQGIKTGWRYTVKECGIQCPVGQIYDECGDSCTRTCDDVATKNICEKHCVEGCRCPKGEYLNENNECVPDKECPCVYDGIHFKTGYKEVRPGRQFLELCVCEGGVWDCDMAEPGDEEKYPPSSELKNQCVNKPYATFSKCVPNEPKTCKNMHDYVENNDDCKPGCACKDGYVYDISTKECVKPEDCSCHHGGKSYSDGDQITEDCNVCLCKSGNWKCTTNVCEATCSVWGDSHFTTFDNHDFDFQGACDYVLSKGTAANGDSYSITIQNVLCGTLGVTCSKSLQIELNGSIRDMITLSADSSFLDDESKLPINKLREQLSSKGHLYNIYKAGVFTVIEIIALKLQIKWDEGTRVYVKLGKEWKGKVSGLCGNYNDNANDDMKTPSQGLETSAFLFGHSWKLQEFCAAPTQQIDACKEHPERETWAQLKCGILKSSLFKECHSEVPVEKYLKRCIFDTCACDQGGDCECLCTAIAAYAYSCAMKGINIRWRTPHLCPMQCDPHCSEYKACTPACAIETCDNFLDQGITDRMCLQENCIEGCQIKPCDEGMIYLNDSFTKCVPKSECKPLCMLKDGKSYFEGDITFTDECQTCRCTKKKEVCSGVPCARQLATTTVSIIEASSTVKPQQTETQVKCVSGWTRWLNQDQDSTERDQKLKLNDEEKLPKFDRFESIYGTCEKKYMFKIECRVVNSHEKAELMDENVFCNLKEGLACRGNCHDYEIRVFCRCGSEEVDIETTEPPVKVIDGKSCDNTIEEYKEYPDDCYKFLHCQPQSNGTWSYVEKTCGPTMMFNPVLHICDHITSVQLMKPACGGEFESTEPSKLQLCPPGKKWSECANHCEHTCHFYGHTLTKRGLCYIGDQCKGGCVDENEPYCPGENKLWRDEKTCVELDECPCMSIDEAYIKPHSVYQQIVLGSTETCQCLDNTFLCQSYAEQKEITTPVPEFTISPWSNNLGTTTEKPFIIPTSTTPPPKCDPKQLVPMINSAEPLPDSVFSASSTLSDSYLPQFGRLHSKPIGESKGSWSPLINDQMQYLQVAFDEPHPLFGIVMQGSPVSDQYVTLFKILHSTDGVGFHYLVDETEKPQMFNGPIDPRTPVESLFKIPIEAKVVRIYPLKWHGSIAMRVELLGCSKESTEPTTEPPLEKLVSTVKPEVLTTTISSWEFTPECVDPMGVENGAMKPPQVKASSIWPRPIKGKKPHLLDMLKMSSSISWRPILNSPSEFVEFDFLEPRNITGVKTKGGTDGWVTGYKVMYSNNGFVWNNILAPDGNPKLFIANNDQDTPQTNYFKYPIQAQLLKVVPVKWEKDIYMRIEPLGCFQPYPEVKEDITVVDSKPVHCPVCDNVLVDPDEKDCKCKPPLMWNGSDCIDRNLCPCVENYISYQIGSKFENKDCQECVCVLGGVKQCKPKKCPSCDEGLRIVQTPTCVCKCEPCPELQKLCPSSGDCIPESLWCNGVKDCEDDEPPECTKVIESIGEPTTEINKTTIKTCPEPKCPDGMKMKIVEQSATRQMSKIFKSTVTKKYSTFNDGHKITRVKSINRVEEFMARPDLEIGFDDIEECAEFVCTPETTSTTVKNVTFSCTLPRCPDDYVVEIDNSKIKPGECLKYTCTLRPQKDHVCELSGKSFTTFDGTEFKYDTCSHILARNLVNSTWYISVQLNCTENRKICRKVLTIKDTTSDAVLSIMPNLKLKFNGFVYTPQQLEKSPLAKSAFIISQPGNTILVVSRSYGFWASYDEIGGIKIGVSEKFIKTVDGLCGYFNGNPADDKRLPDGTVSSSTNKFGDSWFDKEIPKEECYPQVCPRDVQMKALALCNSIKHPSFLKCGKAVNYKQFVSKCIETTCECLKMNKGDPQSCKCSILQGFVKQCLATNPQIQLDTWRAVHQCEISCLAPLVHSDCYKRRCEPSCDNLNGDDCPVLPDACFSGCYCPEGTLRKGDTCIPINECKDCICDTFGTSKYLTYDRKDFTFNGNCTYLLSRDIVLPGVHTFQVFVTMDDCKKLGLKNAGPNTSCAKSLHILHGTHIIHIQRVADKKSVQVLIDGMEVKKLPFKETWLNIVESNSNELKLTLPESHVELTSSFDDMAFSVRVPSIKYGSKMEGLCGDCNGDPENDLKMNPAKKRGRKPSSSKPDIMDIVKSWQADESKLGLDQDECLSEEVAKEDCIPLPPEKDPCLKFFDRELFGECNMIVEPLTYVSACQQDMCKPGNNQKGACNSLAAYARECARNGICLNWRSENLCPYECPPYLQYEPCGCVKTCEMVKAVDVFQVINLRTNIVMNPKKEIECSEGKSEGCFCPPGKVLDNEKCVFEEQCTKCDDGEHAVGDLWEKDKCTHCKCNKDGKTECIQQQCPLEESICSEGFMPSKISSSEECCPKYICVPEPKVPTPITCPDAPFPKCGPGQFKKQKIGTDGCPQFICECKPVSECEPLEENVPLKLGEKLVRDNSGCCPIQNIVCDTKTCPELITHCYEKFYEYKAVTHTGDCCPTVVCTPPKDACIVKVGDTDILKPLGEIWKEPENPCIQKLCAYGPDDTTQVNEIVESCKKSCQKGFEYQKLDASKCCGSCVQTKCVFEDALYTPGIEWLSADNCTTYSCVNIDGHFVVSSSREVCQDVSDCPLEQLEDKGCCKICKPIPESQKNCLPTSLAESETIGLVKLIKPVHGMCINKEPILGFTECYGSCQSGSKYNTETFGQDKICYCCSIETYKAISVPLICEDGLKIKKEIEIPSSCGCNTCKDSSPYNYDLLIDARSSKDLIKRLV